MNPRSYDILKDGHHFHNTDEEVFVIFDGTRTPYQ
jgi:hypothetical protein